jgi:mono/diheme cytochrome c family protein
MNTNLRRLVLIAAVQIFLGIALAASLTWPRSASSEPAAKAPVNETAKAPIPKWSKVSVDLPVSQIPFPPGAGSVIANAYCLICHSTGMVLRQPPLTQDEWTGEINKMRSAFGAPLPADQVEALAKYLRSINGRDSTGKQVTVDGQGS